MTGYQILFKMRLQITLTNDFLKFDAGPKSMNIFTFLSSMVTSDLTVLGHKFEIMSRCKSILHRSKNCQKRDLESNRHTFLNLVSVSRFYLALILVKSLSEISLHSLVTKK